MDFQQTRPDLPFIFVSGTVGEETAVAALKNGAQDYLMKGSLKRLVPAAQRELRDAEDRQTRKRLEAHVQQLQKFEAIGRLAAGIAHDFNHMIGAILGSAEMGIDEAPASAAPRSTRRSPHAGPDSKVILTSGYTAGAASLIDLKDKGAHILQKPLHLGDPRPSHSKSS